MKEYKDVTVTLPKNIYDELIKLRDEKYVYLRMDINTYSWSNFGSAYDNDIDKGIYDLRYFSAVHIDEAVAKLIVAYEKQRDIDIEEKLKLSTEVQELKKQIAELESKAKKKSFWRL